MLGNARNGDSDFDSHGSNVTTNCHVPLVENGSFEDTDFNKAWGSNISVFQCQPTNVMKDSVMRRFEIDGERISTRRYWYYPKKLGCFAKDTLSFFGGEAFFLTFLNV